jgi:Zn-dependent protease
MSWIARRRYPNRSFRHCLLSGFVMMLPAVASEWGHNFAHAAAARWVERPMDYLRITWGTPLVVYNQVNDPQVSPRQHLLRTLGGPLFNLLLLPFTWLARKFTRPGSLGRDAADAAVGTNLFLPAAGLLPLPALDGGPLLKWSVIERGGSPLQAEAVVRSANAAGAAVMGAAGLASLKRRQWGLAALLGQFFVLMLAYALGWLKE